MPRDQFEIAENLHELRNQLAHRLALLLIMACGFFAWLTMPQGLPPIKISLPFALSFSLFLLGVTVQLLMGYFPKLGRHLLVWGLTSGIVLAMFWDAESWVPFLAAVVSFAGAMVVPGSEFVTAGLIGLLAVFLSAETIRDYPLPALLATLGVSLLLTRLTLYNLYTALQWHWTMQQRADRLLEETRKHRADLERTLHSLEAAYEAQARSKQELLQARRYAEEARQMKERFAANISHELRTPLNIILGFSEVIHLSPETYGHFDWPPMLRRDVQEIYRSSRHLLQMIDDILDLSRFQMTRFTLDLEATPLTPLLQDVVKITETLFRDGRVTLEADIPDNLPVLEVDRTRIRQVLLNLLSNAKRFTREGKVRLEAEATEHEVLIRVRDNGCGIPADKLPHIFDEFYQVDSALNRKHAGTGLGLAISKHFVEAHRGRLWAESEEGKGSIFSFTLPIPGRYYGNVQNNVPASRAPVQMKHRPRILFVDADPAVASMVRRNLEEYDVIQVSEPAALGEAIRLHQPFLVIHNQSPLKNLEVPVVDGEHLAFVECALPSQNWLADKLGVVACLSKPVSAHSLMAQIERLGSVHSILIIDDERSFVQLVERLLQTTGRGFNIRRAYGGEHGLSMMRAQRPDLVLLDLAMPDINGMQVLDVMRQDADLRDIAVILLTVASYTEDSLPPSKRQITVRRSGGFYTGETLALLQSIAKSLRP